MPSTSAILAIQPSAEVSRQRTGNSRGQDRIHRQPAAISMTYSLAAEDIVVIVGAGRLALRGISAAS